MRRKSRSFFNTLFRELIEQIIILIGQELDNRLRYNFTVIDATEMTSWNKLGLSFHISVRVTEETVYPRGIHFGYGRHSVSVRGCLPDGRGESPFRSLTNEYGDRLKTMRIDTSEMRIGCRIIVYQLKMLMRCREDIIFYLKTCIKYTRQVGLSVIF